MSEQEIILKLGAEGGSISLLRVSNKDETRFIVEINESDLEDVFYNSENSFETLEDAVKKIYLKYPMLIMLIIDLDSNYILSIAKVISQNTHLRHHDFDNEVGRRSDIKHLEKLSKITQQEWKDLSDLLHQINLSDKQNMFENWPVKHLMANMYEMVDRINLISPFNWGDWDEGYWLINTTGLDYNTLDSLTLAKMVTAINRADRFSGGSWEIMFLNNKLPQLLQALIDKNMNASIINNL
jgi:hypothetical protein